ncbi:acetyl-CoA carboxylase biotin carboxyl carrier protein [Natranaerovirga pectinivora]|uniref:Biotin carboxyl carrier protein of acetyl-CoA carboxylase n=1 Tax=Natranaerovirga pectinivora TaxID=682400 RepID=A0A4V2UZR6_9FIRM|nr:acetyl-CoA carboxylase biotin carboxyl carrier protein [Natranaerovirga pectinivora]TCT12295.1 acetyl-CoA carboxylase biotin carboxyl carrier protein [Natranaerovirga pectinivora]
MEFNQVLELMKAFSESDIHTLKYEHKEFKLKLDKESVGKNIVVTQQQPTMMSTEPIAAQSVAAQAPVVTENKLVAQVEENYNIIKSPIVGTFYSSPSPEAKDYVEVGSKVKKGQVLCIIEAMKLMNEIESEFDGEVVEILVKNEGMVEFGQPLFKIK